MQESKERDTIVTETHHMQQAARVPDMTAVSATDESQKDRRTGALVELDRTEKMFPNPPNTQTENDVTGRFG